MVFLLFDLAKHRKIPKYLSVRSNVINGSNPAPFTCILPTPSGSRLGGFKD